MRRQANRYLRKQEQRTPLVGGSVAVSAIPGTVQQPLFSVVSAWTSDSGRYRYDLAHNRARDYVFVQLIDTHTQDYLGADQITTIDANTVRIWMLTDPGANRVGILYV